MRINFRIILLALPLVFGACSDSSDADTRPAAETISVSVGSGPKIDIESEDKSRTQLGEDGVSVKWASDDQIALWAVNSRSETVFSKQAFKLYHYNTDYNTAKFRGDIPQMPADTYTYYAVSPVPSESDGTQATYLIPDVQDGGFNGDWDVMVADPVKAPALKKNDTGETVQFQFRHKVHVLKIRIPKNDLGEKVSEITLAFPQPVTGRMTVDAADPDAAPTLTGGDNTLTLRFDTPKDAGDAVFAVIAPIELTADQAVTITAICEAGESEPRDIAGKHFSEGHTTPIAYHIPAIGRYYTRLNFSLPADKGTATLGETVEKITLTAPEGSLFDNGTNVRQFTPDAEGKYTMVLKPSWTDNLSGKTVTVRYESESAVVSNTLTMPQITESGSSDITFSVPYLLAEDFSKASSFTGGSSTSGSAAGNDLSDKGLSGWVGGQRLEIDAGKCAVLRMYSNLGGPYHSRIDTAPITSIKEGKTPRVKVTFNCDWKKNKSKEMKITVGLSTETNLNSSISNSTNITLTDNKSASADNIPTSHETMISSFGRNSRIAWKTNGSNGGFVFAYDNVYLDNIKVSIVNE